MQVCLVQERRQLDQHGGEGAAVQVASIVAQLKRKYDKINKCLVVQDDKDDVNK